MTVVEKMALALVDEAKRQNPDCWMDWSTEEEVKAGADERAAYRIHSQHAPLDMMGLAITAQAALSEGVEA